MAETGTYGNLGLGFNSATPRDVPIQNGSDEIHFSDEANDGGSSAEPESNLMRNKVINATKSSLTVFTRFIKDQWPSGDDNMALEVLELQLKYAGGFCTEMQILDLSTTSHVRLDLGKTLGLLRNKTGSCGIKKLKKFVLPNIKILESGDILGKVCRGYCRALCSTTETVIDQLCLHCDEISDSFVAGDLQWIKELRGLYQMSQINFCSHNCTKNANTDFDQFYSALCNDQHKRNEVCDYGKSQFLRQKRSSPLDDTENQSKRRGNDADIDIEGSTLKDNSLANLSDYILWTCWKTDKLHHEGLTGEGVTIAIIDSGIYIAHEAFLDREETEKRCKKHCSAYELLNRIIAINDITSDGDGIDLTNDRNGHGTMCASIACGAAFKSVDPESKKSIRIPPGVAPKTKIVMYKVTTGSSGQPHADMVVKALDQCLEDGKRFNIDIVLLPSGFKYQDFRQDSAIRKLEDAGVLVVTAPGNSGKREPVSYPGASGNTICIGAHNKDCETTSSTTKGWALDFTSPGEGLVGASSAHPTAFNACSNGTSYAASCFAGLLALVIQYIRKCSARDLKKLKVHDVKPDLEEVLHNRVAMKQLLQRYSSSRLHTNKDGYGHIDTKELFSSTPFDLVKALYKNILTSKEL